MIAVTPPLLAVYEVPPPPPSAAPEARLAIAPPPDCLRAGRHTCKQEYRAQVDRDSAVEDSFAHIDDAWCRRINEIPWQFAIVVSRPNFDIALPDHALHVF